MLSRKIARDDLSDGNEVPAILASLYFVKQNIRLLVNRPM